MSCTFTQNEQQNLRDRVQVPMTSAPVQNVCESSREINLELRETPTGMVVWCEDHCNAGQQTQ